MKTNFAVPLIIIGLFIFPGAFSQNQSTRSDTLTSLLKQSGTNHKALFLVFGWQGCSWCRLFDKYHSDSVVNGILDKYFMIAKIDIMKTTAGADLYKTYGKEGTPSWTIFDSNGNVLIDSDNGNSNVGYPAEEKELEHYVSALKKAAPFMNDSECGMLVAKLKDYKHMKQQNML